MACKRKKMEINIQEMDCRRIAQDLHDSSLQSLAHLIHELELASMYIDRDTVQAKLELASIGKDINMIIDEIRDIIFDLRPMIFDDLGLKEAIERLLDKAKKRCPMIIFTDLDEIRNQEETVLLGIFRIIQESVNNACKYAEAKHLWVSLKEREDLIEVHVKDDGKGFSLKEEEKKENHFGLIMMRERVEIISGKMEIISKLGEGTSVTVSIEKTKRISKGDCV